MSEYLIYGTNQWVGSDSNPTNNPVKPKLII